MGGGTGAEGLPKSDRLRKRRDYLAVQNRGKKFHEEHFLAFVLPSAGPGRFGFTVSSKVGKAVARNRVRRLLREVVRRARAALPGSIDVVFVAKRKAVHATFSALAEEVVTLGRRLRRGER